MINQKNYMNSEFSKNGNELVVTESDFATDTFKGLSSIRKYLLPKYFYDETGTGIFQKIMNMPEYYPTACEHEIFTTHKEYMSDIFNRGSERFDLIELGSGDGVKTMILLQKLVEQRSNLRFVPIDISPTATAELTGSLKKSLPDLLVEPLTGDYFHLTDRINGSSRKVILFLGSNIGNFPDEELDLFLQQLSGITNRGDKAVIGFDLKKSPAIIMNAYDDRRGLTAKFNLNHLSRINRELDADFDLQMFEHFTEYNPVSGALNSYLISKAEQRVFVEALGQSFLFKKWEPVFMELSRKFELETIERLAADYGFEVERHLTDRLNYFTDSIWTKTS
jgi:L-histidine Nalpha-methyltransferase